MFSRFRLFASEDNLFLNNFYRPELIKINLSDTLLSFNCPVSSSWREDSHDLLIDDICLSDNSDYQLPQADLFYTENKYKHKTIFYREWSLWGSAWNSECLGVTSMMVKLIHVPSKTPDDCLFVYDKLKEALPSLVNKGYQDGAKASKIGGGLMRNHRNVSYSRARVNEGHPDRVYDRMYFTIDCEHVLLVEHYNAKAPYLNDDIFRAMEFFVDKIYSSIRIVRSDKADESRKTANKKYAESTGAYYDEELGDVLETINFPSDDE